MIETDCVGPEGFIRREASRRAMLPHRSRIATKSVKDVRPIRRTGRFGLRAVSNIRAGPMGPTVFFFLPATKIAPAQ